MLTLVLGDLHLKDLTNSNYDRWQYKMFLSCFDSIVKTIQDKKISKLILCGDTFDTPPKGSALELFAKFMSLLRPLNLEIKLIDGNHELLSGVGKNYYCLSMKEYFKLNYNVDVLDYIIIDNALYCSHSNIRRLEKLNKPIDIVYSHFRSNIPPIVDEIDISALNRYAKLVILGDIHTRNQKDNIVYTGSPIDTHFDGNNSLSSHTPSVIIINEETLEWEWVTTLDKQFRKKKVNYTSVLDFQNDIPNIKDDYLIHSNFYKCVIQDKKVNLNTIKPELYQEFCIISKSAIDLDIAKENKKIATEIIKNLSTTNISQSLLEFILKNNDRKDLTPKLKSLYHKYEVHND